MWHTFLIPNGWLLAWKAAQEIVNESSICRDFVFDDLSCIAQLLVFFLGVASVAIPGE